MVIKENELWIPLVVNIEHIVTMFSFGTEGQWLLVGLTFVKK
jgi:hypothetical protein